MVKAESAVLPLSLITCWKLNQGTLAAIQTLSSSSSQKMPITRYPPSAKIKPGSIKPDVITAVDRNLI